MGSHDCFDKAVITDLGYNEGCWLCRRLLTSLALMARPCVQMDGFRESWSVVLVTNPGERPAVAKVSSRRVVVACLKDFFSQAGRNNQQPGRVARSEVLLEEHTSPQNEA
mgnify:CR=1 FL=1